MNTHHVGSVYDNSNDQYPHFSEAIKERFSNFSNKLLFTTDASELFEAFVNNMPENARQHYRCRCCETFIRRFGGLVNISDDGAITSVLWDENNTPKFFIESVKAMKLIVSKAKVTGVFISNTQELGQPHVGGWDHLSVKLPTARVYKETIGKRTAEQEVAYRLEEYKNLNTGLNEFTLETVEQAVALLETNSLEQAEKHIDAAEFLQRLHKKRLKAKNSRNRDNITWLAAATAPFEFCHVKNTVLGTLLKDISDVLTFEAINRRYTEKMRSENYMRSQAAPSEGNIQQAERIVAERKIANSLNRRFAKFDEIPHFVWKNRKSVKKQSEPAGVFGHIAPKEKTVESNKIDLPSTTMTWDKFSKTVLPTAENIEVKVENFKRMMALVTAADETAPNILKWDNTFSWYYHTGIDGEIKRRVENAGGKHEGNDIRCSLIWEGFTDLDLHCSTPNGEHINYNHKRSICGGWLDIDMNGMSHRDPHPVENIRFEVGKARNGKYSFVVHNYAERGKLRETPFKVELEVSGEIYTFHGSLKDDAQTVVFSFEYVQGQQPVIENHTPNDAWNVPVNSFVKVTGITNSPNLWGEENSARTGHHIFFLLDGCKDLSQGKGRGFFVETLKSEYREIRKTLEAYAANAIIEDAETASACGVGYSKEIEWNLILRVTSNNSTRLIKIDRFD